MDEAIDVDVSRVLGLAAPHLAKPAEELAAWWSAPAVMRKVPIDELIKTAGGRVVMSTRSFVEGTEHDLRMLPPRKRKIVLFSVERKLAAFLDAKPARQAKHANLADLHLSLRGADLKEFCTLLVEAAIYRMVVRGEPLVIRPVSKAEHAIVTDAFERGVLNNPGATAADMAGLLAAQTACSMRASLRQAAGCAACGVVTGKLMKCGRCKAACYCSEACQRGHWPAHKGICGGGGRA